ncbi:MAG: sigma-70 family RNA polymerase sigma factor [Halieaceae bacterium]|jgi:RNA polymerase sigma-70 factor (ECF subfamily)|nr:sigma-70 family RNA polymerase sigma factor [Halieaceae bacterium]
MASPRNAKISNRQRDALMEELGGLRRFSLSLTGSSDDADDLLQATVERLLEKGIPEDAHTARWAYRVCKNLWIDELRSREVRVRHASTTLQTSQGGALGEPAEVAPSAEAQSAGEQTLEAVNAALMRLPEEQRMALTLVAVEGKSYAEAAEILEVPIGTIMSRIARARKQLLDATG